MNKHMRKTMQKALPWSFLGVVVTVLLGIPALYVALHEKNPDIVFEIVADANVLDVHKPLKDLTVMFRGEDIQKNRQNLRIFTITVRNVGEVNVVQTAFDQNRLWGLQFPGSRIVHQPRLIDSNSDYIKDNLNPRVTEESIVGFSKIIFERGKYFTIEVQILHGADSPPPLKPIGKIAGVEEQRVVRATGSTQPTFWQELFAGGALVLTVRAVLSFAAFILVIIGLIGLLEFKDRLQRKRRQRRERLYLAPVLRNMEPRAAEALLSVVNHMGINKKRLDTLLQFLSDEAFLEKVKAQTKESKEMHLRTFEQHTQAQEQLASYGFLLQDAILQTAMDIVKYDKDGKLRADERLVDGLKALREYVQETPPPKNLSGGSYYWLFEPVASPDKE